MSKFKVGERVCLFNSVSMSIEWDEVYAVLYVPVAVGEGSHEGGIGERLSRGEMEVREQYQLVQHQGVLDSGCLFGSEEECRGFFRDFFGK